MNNTVTSAEQYKLIKSVKYIPVLLVITKAKSITNIIIAVDEIKKFHL